MASSLKALLIWPARAVIYLAAVYLGVFVIAEAIGGVVGIIAGAPLAAVAVGVDLWLSAKLRGLTLEQSVASRLLFVDQLLSPAGESLKMRESAYAELTEGQEVEAEVLEEGYPELPERGH